MNICGDKIIVLFKIIFIVFNWDRMIGMWDIFRYMINLLLKRILVGLRFSF